MGGLGKAYKAIATALDELYRADRARSAAQVAYAAAVEPCSQPSARRSVPDRGSKTTTGAHERFDARAVGAIRRRPRHQGRPPLETDQVSGRPKVATGRLTVVTLGPPHLGDLERDALLALRSFGGRLVRTLLTRFGGAHGPAGAQRVRARLARQADRIWCTLSPRPILTGDDVTRPAVQLPITRTSAGAGSFVPPMGEAPLVDPRISIGHERHERPGLGIQPGPIVVGQTTERRGFDAVLDRDARRRPRNRRRAASAAHHRCLRMTMCGTRAARSGSVLVREEHAVPHRQEPRRRRRILSWHQAPADVVECRGARTVELHQLVTE